MPREPFVSRVRVRNFKSIAACDVELRQFTILVGRNGAGKSNFLDALRFVAQSLQDPLDQAIRSRGGIDEVRRRSTGHPHNFAISLELNLPDFSTATYSFEIGAESKAGYSVREEELQITDARGQKDGFHVVRGVLQGVQPDRVMPPVDKSRLYLVNAAGLPEFRPAFDGLKAMGFYNLNPEKMKEVQSPDAGDLLHRDGGNIASVIGRLTEDRSEAKERIKEYLGLIVPDVEGFERVSLARQETVQFRQKVGASPHPWRFYAASMSDGTLRALGVLVAVMQLVGRSEPIPLVGIEEPETALHPAAAGALMDALRDATQQTQVIVTSHSADLLDHFDPDQDALLAVAAEKGKTIIAPADPASSESIKNHLFSAGELLRMDQLQPDRRILETQGVLPFAASEDNE